MNIAKEVLDILVCPETKQKLNLISESELKHLNEAIKNNNLKVKSGKLIKDQLSAALIREDGKILYPVVGNIPQLLVDSGIDASALH